MTSLGELTTGIHRKQPREENDFYATPDECTLGLLEYEASLPRRIWEPCCGDGAISRILGYFGHDVVSSDLIDRGYGVAGVDFLETDVRQADAIITNPPFKIAHKIIEHAHVLGVPYLALVLKASYWHAANRVKLFNRFPPTKIYPMAWRPDWSGEGRPTMECMWCVWDTRFTGTHYLPMVKPKLQDPDPFA